MTHTHPLLAHFIVRWVQFAAMVFAIGIIAFGSLVIPKSSWPSWPSRFLIPLRRGLMILIIADATDLILRAQMISGRPLSEIIPVLPVVLSQTHYGKVWMGRQIVIWVMLLGSLSGNNRRVTLNFGLFGSAGLCLTTTLSGHAANSGDFSLAVLTDGLHLIAISCWIGGLWPLRLSIGMPNRSISERADLLARFSRLAAVCLIIMILSGDLSAWLRLRTPAALFASSWGITLAIKVLLVVVVVGHGAAIRIWLLPQLLEASGRARDIGPMTQSVFAAIRRFVARREGREAATPLDRVKYLTVWLGWEMAVAGLVLAAAALLTILPPPASHM